MLPNIRTRDKAGFMLSADSLQTQRAAMTDDAMQLSFGGNYAYISAHEDASGDTDYHGNSAGFLLR